MRGRPSQGYILSIKNLDTVHLISEEHFGDIFLIFQIIRTLFLNGNPQEELSLVLIMFEESTFHLGGRCIKHVSTGRKRKSKNVHNKLSIGGESIHNVFRC